ncbi:MAG: hypothetical protein WAL34_04105 [Acidobacteriaceae bacterium]
MRTDSEYAVLCAAIYNPQSKWDKIWTGNGNGIFAGVFGNTVVFRGSDCPLDWLRDFDATLYDHPELGPVHCGMMEGLDDFFAETAKLLGSSPDICGHSLGAAHAWLFAGLLARAGNNPSRIAVFGSPRPGCQQLRDILTPISKSSYRNGNDPVTDVPVFLPGFPYVEPCDFTQLDVPPATHDLLHDHHIEQYVAGVEALAGEVRANAV